MAWFRKRRYTVLQPPAERKDRIPDGLFHKCENCLNLIYRKDFEGNLKVCPRCNHHHRLSAWERINMLVEEGTFEEDNTEIYPADPLGFIDSRPYLQRLAESQEKTKLADAVVTGTGKIANFKVCLAVMDFSFIGGSMGSVVGEKVTRSLERGLKEKLPVIAVCTSGGARMQEGILSLMQMAKTSIAVARLSEERLPYITLLTNPTTAGVMASFASLGDVVLAEPGALIGFAGPRVIQQTINQILPKGFQTAEFVCQHGFVDKVVQRKELKKTIINLLSFFVEPLNP